MLTTSEQIILNLAHAQTAAAGDVPPIEPTLTGSARVAAQQARHRDIQAADGWMPTPRIGSERSRQRIVRDLIDRGLIEPKGNGRSRLIRLTPAGWDRANAIQGTVDA